MSVCGMIFSRGTAGRRSGSASETGALTAATADAARIPVNPNEIRRHTGRQRDAAFDVA